jgi:hypothetical protein
MSSQRVVGSRATVGRKRNRSDDLGADEPTAEKAVCPDPSKSVWLKGLFWSLAVMLSPLRRTSASGMASVADAAPEEQTMLPEYEPAGEPAATRMKTVVAAIVPVPEMVCAAAKPVTPSSVSETSNPSGGSTRIPCARLAPLTVNEVAVSEADP